MHRFPRVHIDKAYSAKGKCYLFLQHLHARRSGRRRHELLRDTLPPATVSHRKERIHSIRRGNNLIAEVVVTGPPSTATTVIVTQVMISVLTISIPAAQVLHVLGPAGEGAKAEACK